MKRLLPSFIFFSLFLTSIFAQLPCGTNFETQQFQLQRLTQNRLNVLNFSQANTREDLVYIPVKFHLVGRTDSSLVINEKATLDILCGLNTKFGDQDIQYYLDYPYNYIFNDTLFYFEPYPIRDTLIHQNKVNDAINIFITRNVEDPLNVGFYQGPPGINDYIVLRQSANSEYTPSHMLGHFFSLAHPFFGWSDPWDELIHGIQVDSLTSIGAVVEKMDMSNCEIAADQICDTPPDYLFAFSIEQDECEPWDGGTLDPCGILVDPMENNIMSYFVNCDDYLFTEEQKQVIRMDYDSPEREYIQTDYVPNQAENLAPVDLLYPIDDEITPGFSTINFEWDAVAGADYYLLEIDLLPTFSFEPRTFITQNTGKIVSGIFEPDKKYYWRVLAFAEYNLCSLNYSDTESFKSNIINNSNDIDLSFSFSFQPNPSHTNSYVTIEIFTKNNISGKLELYNSQGSLVQESSVQTFHSGENQYLFDLKNAPPAVYTLVLRTNGKCISQKMVVID